MTSICADMGEAFLYKIIRFTCSYIHWHFMLYFEENNMKSDSGGCFQVF